MKQQIQISEETAFKSLGSEYFLKVDKRLCILYEPNIALFLVNLIDFRNYLKSINKLEKDGWFFYTHEDQQDHIKLSEKAIRNCKNYLKQEKIILTKRKGIPAKEWYFIDIFELVNKLETIQLHSSHVILVGQDLPERQDKGLLNGRTRPTGTAGLYINNNTYKEQKYKKPLAAKAALPAIAATADEKTHQKQIFQSDELVQLTHFEIFYKLYPRNAQKGKALIAWNNLCNQKGKQAVRPTWKIVRKALRLQKQTKQWQDKKYIPYPATWINQLGWLNNPDEMNNTYEKQNKPKSFGYMGKTKLKYPTPIQM